VTLGKLCALLTDPETTASPNQLYKRLYASFSVADLRSIAEECDAIARSCTFGKGISEAARPSLWPCRIEGSSWKIGSKTLMRALRR